MLDDYDEWSEKIDKEIEANSGYLGLVQLSLSVGVVCLLLSASMVFAETAYGVRPALTLGVVLTLLLTTRTYLGERD